MLLFKEELLKGLENQIKTQQERGTKQDRERARRTAQVLQLVKNCNKLVYNIQLDGNDNTHFNIGVIIENIFNYDFNDLYTYCNVITLVNNTANIITNTKNATTYAVILKATIQAVYEYKTKDLLNKRLTLKELQTIPHTERQDLAQLMGIK